MSKKKSDKKDRHVSRVLVGIPRDVHDQLKILADRNDRPLTREIRRLLVAALEAEKLWPPGSPT